MWEGGLEAATEEVACHVVALKRAIGRVRRAA